MRHTTRFRAQSLIEFALIIPLVLALLLGFFDLGRAVFYYSSLSNAVREGARSGIVMSTGMGVDINSALKDKVLEYAFGLTTTTVPLIADDINVNITKDGEGYLETLRITATFCYVPITPGIKGIVGNGCKEGTVQGIELTAESVMRFEPMLK